MTFQELDAYLNQEFSEDYWYDDAKFYACELVKQLTTDDWNALKSSWHNHSKQWQERCAEILDWGDARQAVPVLLEMIQVEDDELTLTAADSLSSIGVAELDLPVSEDVLSRLQAVAHSGNVAKLIINQLLGQLEIKAYRDFLIEVLQATEESGADSQVVYPLLEANQEKLDENFAKVLRAWLTATLPEVEPEQAYGIAAAVGNFSHLIQQFPHGNQSNNIEIAIAGYEVVTTVITQEVSPEEWAMIQDDLGNAYCDRIEGDWAENMEKAIRYYEAAMEVYTHKDFPQDWAMTQNNLGIAYFYRIQGESAENLEAAIRSYLSALEVSNRQAFPRQWAIIQNNLGNAYLWRIRGERSENLEAAIRCYFNTLDVYTREAFPQGWAMSQNNLGMAYRERIQGDKAENWKAAIHCFLAALEVRTPEDYPEDYAATQFNLGLVYQNAIEFSNAYKAYAAAIDTVESLWDEFVYDEETKQQFAKQWNILYLFMVQVCLKLGDYAKAIEYIERGQAQNLVELLANPELYADSEIPVEIFNELERLRQKITFQPQLIHMETELRRRGILTWKSA